MLAVLMLLPCFIYASAAEALTTASVEEDIELAEMVCRIKNASTGLYLDSYKYTLWTDGKAYLENYSEGSLGQVFHLSPNEDGTYFIFPQNDNAAYAYSYSSGSSADKLVQKVNASNPGEHAKFDIVEHNDNRFIIAPSNFSDSEAVLTQSETITKYNDYYAELLPLRDNADKQLWVIEPIATEKLTVVFTSTKVRLYSTGKFYARKHPYNIFTSDIKWSSSDEDVLIIGDDGAWCALDLGTVTVTASVGSVSKSFEVTVTDKDAFTWYSQNNVYTSDWDATQLLPLKFNSGGIVKKFAVDSKEPGGSYCWMDEGCGNAAMAMILNNLGAVKTTGYDFRSGQTDNLVADPYTVALANTGNYGATDANSVLTSNPIYMRWDYVARQFSLDGKTLTLKREFWGVTRSRIRDLLEEHPEGVLVQVQRGEKNHYLVFTECVNPDEKVNSYLKFMVCDSAAYKPENGDYVPFEQSTSYLAELYRYGNITSVAYFTFAED
ncbi:MAG: hypothetical protein ACI3XI_05560 [Eubacteriales bacterium]